VNRTHAEEAREGEDDRIAEAELFARILVPIDFSAASRRALLFALDLRRRFGGQVYLVNVTGPSDGDDFLGGLGAHWWSSDLTQEADDDLHRFVEHVAPGEAAIVACDIELEGDVARAVADAVERYGATVVLVTKNGKKRPLLLRSRTERIAAKVCCAVMTIACEPEPEPPRD
jgi:nucleotide-binding universal stress UspA family protein